MRVTRLACTLALIPVLSLAATPLRPGQWEMRLQFTGDEGAMQPTVVSQCLKTADATDIASIARLDNDDPTRCKVSNLRNTGNRTSWDLVCSGEGAGSQHAEFVLAADHYEGTIKVTEADSGESLTMRYTGRRLGDCR